MGVRVRGSHTYVNITDENLCAQNLRIVGLVQKVRNFDASKISTFTVAYSASKMKHLVAAASDQAYTAQDFYTLIA